jgi:acyl-CoA reductase-like NAD-dependent aldehyde dehydrogenase
MSTERIIVHQSIAPQVKEVLKSTMDEVFAGKAPILVNSLPVEMNKKLLKDAVGKGAKLIYGDIDHNEESETRMRPVIIENVTPGMEIYYTECFGPTVSTIEIETDEQAIQIANEMEYGLSSAVYTEDLRRGLMIAKQIETGAVNINGMTVPDEAA